MSYPDDMATDRDEDTRNDPLQDVPDIERMIVNRGIIPDVLMFWRRKGNKSKQLGIT